MRPLLLAISAAALLTTGTALSVQVIRLSAPEVPAAREAVAASPAPALNSEIEKHTAQAAAVPTNEPTAASVVRVKTVRIDPERPLGTTQAEQAASAADLQRQDAATANDQSGTPPVSEAAAAPKTVTPPAASAEDRAVSRVRTARAKSPVVSAKRTAHVRRKREPAPDDATNTSLSYAPKEAGPESLNPLGKLLGGR
ncbi:MAG: hypothetical protein JO004_13770 [Methylobacteriaceae bacterium]|nr:hypothetical protein [Methylobacteriaceae bacterium]